MKCLKPDDRSPSKVGDIQIGCGHYDGALHLKIKRGYVFIHKEIQKIEIFDDTIGWRTCIQDDDVRKTFRKAKI